MIDTTLPLDLTAPPVSIADYGKGLGVRLTEPDDRPLRAEVAALETR